jgi:hypothetical protein
VNSAALETGDCLRGLHRGAQNPKRTGGEAGGRRAWAGRMALKKLEASNVDDHPELRRDIYIFIAANIPLVVTYVLIWC